MNNPTPTPERTPWFSYGILVSLICFTALSYILTVRFDRIEQQIDSIQRQLSPNGEKEIK